MSNIEALLDGAKIDAAVEERHKLVALCESTKKNKDKQTYLYGVTLAVELSLVALDRDAALSLLAPYLTKDGTDLATDRIQALQHTHLFTTAAILSAAADFLFRQRSYRAANQAAQWADDLFGTFAGGLESERVLRLVMSRRLWNLARWARISWRATGRPETAIQHLESCLMELDAARRYMPARRAHSIEAFVLDFWASLNWACGKLSEAHAQIYRALFLVRHGGVADRVRLGHTLFTAGKLEASLTDPMNFRRAVELLEASEKVFAKIRNGHPLTPLPSIQKAEVYIRANDAGQAERILDDLANSGQLKEPAHRAEAALAWCWLHASKEQWQKVSEAGEQMLSAIGELRTPPPRLLADAHYQLGRARLNLGKQEEAIKDLHQALDVAEKNSRVRIAIAAHLELAAAYRTSNEALCKRHWEQANKLLSDFPSAYLQLRRNAIAQSFSDLWIFRIGTTKFKDARRQFEREFFEHLRQKYDGNLTLAAREAGVARTTAFHALHGRTRGGSTKGSAGRTRG